MLSRDVEAYDEYCERTQPSEDYTGPSQPRRIPADPRLAAIADQLAESILATLAAHGYAIVREADTQSYDEQRQRDFAREAARNAVGILGMEGTL